MADFSMNSIKPSIKKICSGIMIALCIFSCTKKANTYEIPDSFQPWCRYKTGSYWVYQNMKTGQLDSTYVASYSAGTNTYYDDDKLDYYWNWESSDFDHVSGDGIHTYSRNSNSADMSFYFKFGGLDISSDLIANPRFINAWYDGQSSSGIVAVIPNEIVNGNNFTNVYHYRNGSQMWNGDSLIVDVHLVKGIGIIELKRRIDQVDTTWTLVRWHAVQ